MSDFDFAARVGDAQGAPLRRDRLTTLQVNLTTRCNLACHPCHVESGPLRPEALDSRVRWRVRLRPHKAVSSRDAIGDKF